MTLRDDDGNLGHIDVEAEGDFVFDASEAEDPILLNVTRRHACNYYYYNHYTLSGTSRVSRYQKKHSPTHTLVIHQPLSASSIFHDPPHLPTQFTCLTVPPTISLQALLSTQPLSSLCSSRPRHRNLPCCSIETLSSNPNPRNLPL